MELTLERLHNGVSSAVEPYGLGPVFGGRVTQRRRSELHTFEDRIATEKARLETQFAYTHTEAPEGMC